MKLTTLFAALAALCALVQSAQARAHYRHGDLPQQTYVGAARYDGLSDAEVAHGGFGSRPAAWCGWQMRQLVGSDPGPTFNLARNWAHWGQAGPAGVGAIVVWPHHVGKIVGEENGMWLIESGNDGHALRTRARSVAGAIAIRWG